MEESLKAESERLARSWMQHEAAGLRDYLVREVEDPRINLQSIFSRHLLLRALFGERSLWLMEQEYRFAASMNWLIGLARRLSEPEELQAVLDALRRGLDNAEGIGIPRLFTGVRFELGNVFEIAAAGYAFDLCFVHDLFEHLSPEGLTRAVREVCRVTRRGICVGFFNLDEIPDHVVRPSEEYHWNTLSLSRMKQLFGSHGFTAQVMNAGAFLRQHVGASETHNPNACTFFLWRTT